MTFARYANQDAESDVVDLADSIEMGPVFEKPRHSFRAVENSPQAIFLLPMTCVHSGSIRAFTLPSVFVGAMAIQGSPRLSALEQSIEHLMATAVSTLTKSFFLESEMGRP